MEANHDGRNGSFSFFIALMPGRLWADYKPEFKLSLNVDAETSWGRAAQRFSRYGAVSHRWPYSDHVLFSMPSYSKANSFLSSSYYGTASADFSVGSTINS